MAAYIIKHFKDYNDPSLLHLDAGGFSHFSTAEGIIKTKTIIELNDLMHMDAVNITAWDLAQDVSLLVTAIEGKKTPYISANIVDSENGKPFFQTHVILGLGEHRIAIVGVAATTNKSWLYDSRTLIIADPLAKLKDLLPTLECDCVILLTDISRARIAPILREIGEIDLVLGADGFSVTPKESMIYGVPTSYVGTQGEHLGIIRYSINNNGIKVLHHDMVRMKKDYLEDKEVKRIVEAAKREIKEMGEDILEEYFSR